MRRAAYRIPEHRARHWAMLMAADRIDVPDDRLGAALRGRSTEPDFTVWRGGSGGIRYARPVLAFSPGSFW